MLWFHVLSAYLLRLDATALWQLIQCAEKGTGTRHGGVTRLDASFHTSLCHPIHHSATGSRNKQLSIGLIAKWRERTHYFDFYFNLDRVTIETMCSKTKSTDKHPWVTDFRLLNFRNRANTKWTKLRVTNSLSRSRWDFLFENDRFLVSGSAMQGPARSYSRWGLPRICHRRKH